MSEPAPPRRRPRVAGIVALVFAAGVLIAGLASLSLDDPKVQPIRITGAGEVQQLFGGIRQDGAKLGSPNAPVTIDLFNDLQCDNCSEYQLAVVPPLVEDFVRTDKASLTYRHFPMGQRERVVADFGAVAAAQQDREWQYVELFFINQDEAKRTGVTQEFLDDVAGAVLELDTDQWRRDFDSAAINTTLEADSKLAIDLRLPAEPAIVVTGPVGTKQLDESPSLEEIEAAISEVS
ncbi:MAG: DsbA family protein [Solirubrobacterales bacterium]